MNPHLALIRFPKYHPLSIFYYITTLLSMSLLTLQLSLLTLQLSLY